MKKICKKCKLEKEMDEFYNAKSFKDGKTYECKVCMTFYRQKNKEKNRLYAANRQKTNPEKVRKLNNEYWERLDVAKKLIRQARQRSKRKNIPFNLTESDLIIPNQCPFLETPFILGKKFNYQYTYSLDRIDNNKGYIKGNVQILTMKANNMKNSASLNELLMFAKNIFLQNKDNEIVQNIVKELYEK